MGNDWKQAEFDTREIDDAELTAKLAAQIGVLCVLERQRAEAASVAEAGKDGQAPSGVFVPGNGEGDTPQPPCPTEQLDPSLLRTACSTLKRVLVEAAVADGAVLLSDSVTDPIDAERRQEKWARWLLEARCWPPLLREHWSTIRWHAAAMVHERLKKECDSKLDTVEGRDILAAVRQLELADLVTEATLREAFPSEATEKDEGGTEAVEAEEAC